MKILLFGKNGQVGWELNRSLQPLGEVVALGRDQADFSKPESLRKIVQTIKPDVIVNAVAYTAVDKAESEEGLAKTINSVAPEVLAEEALKINALLIHYSTDYVFDGTKKNPCVEEDQPNPLNVYGRSKLLGEQLIKDSGCEFLVFRTSWVYGVRGNNFLLTMLKLMRERDKLSIVNDQIGTPTCSRHIAETTANIIWQSQLERAGGQFTADVYHLTSSGETTWYGFAQQIAKMIRENKGKSWLTIKDIEPITSREYPVPAKRPMNSLLACGKLESKYKLVMPDWKNCLELSMQELRL